MVGPIFLCAFSHSSPPPPQSVIIPVKWLNIGKAFGIPALSLVATVPLVVCCCGCFCFFAIRLVSTLNPQDPDAVAWVAAAPHRDVTSNMMRWMRFYAAPCGGPCCYSADCGWRGCSGCGVSLTTLPPKIRYQCMDCPVVRLCAICLAVCVLFDVCACFHCAQNCPLTPLSPLPSSPAIAGEFAAKTPCLCQL